MIRGSRVIDSPSIEQKGTIVPSDPWPDIRPGFPGTEQVVDTTRATTSTATTVSSIRDLLGMRRRDERVRRLSPDRRALYEEIVELRSAIGPVALDVVEAIRELRENA